MCIRLFLCLAVMGCTVSHPALDLPGEVLDAATDAARDGQSDADGSVDSEVLDASDGSLADGAPVDAMPVDASMDAMPVDASMDAMPVDAAMDAMPVDAAMDAMPVDAAMDAMPVDAAMDATMDSDVPDTMDAGCEEGEVFGPCGDRNGCQLIERCRGGERVCEDDPIEAISCNGRDEDCDGDIEESGPIDGLFVDGDGDGFGDSPATTTCDGVTLVSEAGDCDDGRGDVFPGAAESCGDDTDRNCDGIEGFCDCVEVASGGVDYWLCRETQNWMQARVRCLGFGGHLARIATAEEQAFLAEATRELGRSVWWIEANDRSTEGTFEHEDDSPVYDGAWSGGEPNNAGGREDCAHIAWYDASWGGRWNDNVCNHRGGFICEFE